MMKNVTSRKEFLSRSLVFTSGCMLTPHWLLPQDQESPKPIDLTIVNEFVKVAHTDFDAVKEMIKEYPLLLNASWDWGGGDFETALGAAGHMGHKDIAHFLIGLGARTDLFVLTMLGHTELVKATLNAYPNLLTAPGPHGFTLLHHAEKGGKEAEPLAAHLRSLGLTESLIKLQ